MNISIDNMTTCSKSLYVALFVFGLFLVGIPNASGFSFRKGQVYNRPCPFHTKQDNIKINNVPSFPERAVIRTFHFVQRSLLQKGGVDSKNFFVRLISKPVKLADLVWANVVEKKSYHAKRLALFGPNFVSCMALHLTKFDESAQAEDSIDANLVSLPQAKTLDIGAFPVNPSASSWYGEGETKKGWKGKKSLVPLYVSSEGKRQNPLLPEDQPNHAELNGFLMDNFLGEKQLKAIFQRQTDEVGSKLLNEFGQKAKDLGGEELKKVVGGFLPKYLLYILFDVDVSKIPQEAVDMCGDTFFANMFLPLPLLQGKTQKQIDAFVDFVYEESSVVQAVKDGPKGLGKRELCEMIPVVFVTAGFLGTRDLTSRSIVFTPEGYVQSVVDDDKKLRNAVLETSRLDCPVPFSALAVDNPNGITTKIGKKEFTFPDKTPMLNFIRGANWNEERFPDPFVFDPENRDFSQLLTFNSVGEQTYGPSPRICPGREVAISTAMLLIKAKFKAD